MSPTLCASVTKGELREGTRNKAKLLRKLQNNHECHKEGDKRNKRSNNDIYREDVVRLVLEWVLS